MNMEPHKGCILISEPFLRDPHFRRTVIVVTEHGEDGTVGFVLNHETALTVQDLFEDFECIHPVYVGGPVAKNTFHYLHTFANLEDAKEVLPGLYWGGNFDTLRFYFSENLVNEQQAKFFAGYSGWAPGQLEEELHQKSWIVAQGKPEYVFDKDTELWKHVLAGLGKEFEWLSKAPEDIQLN